MIAIGNDELGVELKEGNIVRNTNSGVLGVVEFASDDKGNKSSILCFVSATEGSLYVCGISGRIIAPWVLVV